jgi:hypothetical protein
MCTSGLKTKPQQLNLPAPTKRVRPRSGSSSHQKNIRFKMTTHHETKDRLAWREKVARDLGVVINPPLSFRAARFASQHKTRDELVQWLVKPNTVNTWQMGKKTYSELCLAFGLAVPAKAPRTMGRKLAEAQARIKELEARIEELKAGLRDIFLLPRHSPPARRGILARTRKVEGN